MRTFKYIAALFVAVSLSLGLAPSASAKAVELQAPVADYPSEARNPVIYVKHVQGRWHYAELADGSQWAVTRCRYEDSRNCYWNARVRGNGEGRSFVDLRGVMHRVDTRMQP